MADKKSSSSTTAKSAHPELLQKISVCIDERIRPFINMDGGEIELVELTEDKILKVRLHGACHGCMASSITLQSGVQEAINQEFPDEDIQLELIDMDPGTYVPHAPPQRF